MNERRSVCFVVSSPATVHAFLKEIIEALSDKHSLALVANTEGDRHFSMGDIPVHLFPMRVERRISPVVDLMALWQLVRLFRKERFDLVQSVTPKAGLLAMIAGRLARIPVRSHIFTGQVWATRTGFGRWFLKQMDRLIASMATHVLADSHSQREFLIQEGVVSSDKISVLANGSISGVDAEKFRPDAKARLEIRSSLDIPDTAILFVFLGRLNRDKGVLDLASAFARLPHRSHLMLVGPDEEGIGDEVIRAAGSAASRVHLVGATNEPWRYLAAGDAFCLPSYREGFGTSVIEAAACGLPAVASRIYGLTDAVEDGATGLLFPPGDVEALAAAMNHLAMDDELRLRLGRQAQERAIRDFSSEQVTRAWLDYYAALL